MGRTNPREGELRSEGWGRRSPVVMGWGRRSPVGWGSVSVAGLEMNRGGDRRSSGGSAARKGRGGEVGVAPAVEWRPRLVSTDSGRRKRRCWPRGVRALVRLYAKQQKNMRE